MAYMKSLLSRTLPFVKSAQPIQVLSEHWEDRFAIRETRVNLFCWQRRVEDSIPKYLEQIVHTPIPPLSFTAHADQLADQLSHARKAWDPSHSKEADAFWIDVFEITRDFLGLSGKEQIRVYLRKVEDDACTKFHVDGYALRLMTTYFGPGTEWLPEDATRRYGLGKRNSLIVKDSAKIQRMSTFEVGILKGEKPYQNNLPRGIVHRSPSISAAGNKRIILRVDV
jgi:hypothetical protein